MQVKLKNLHEWICLLKGISKNWTEAKKENNIASRPELNSGIRN